MHYNTILFQNQENELGSYSDLHQKIPDSLFSQFPAYGHDANSGLSNRDLKWDNLPPLKQNSNSHLNLETTSFVNGHGIMNNYLKCTSLVSNNTCGV